MEVGEIKLEPIQVVLGLAVALAIGGLVGLERERHAQARGKSGFGGARTFPLVALLGALAALLAGSLGAPVVVVAFGAVAALLAIGYLRSGRGGDSAELGLTTEFSALLVFVIGTLPFLGPSVVPFEQRLLLAAALGTVVTTLLALRQPIHHFVERLSQEDILATLRFTLVAVVALPLLPDRAYDPFGALNPFRIGVVIVLIAGISFVGYVAVRMFGTRRGIGLTALAGGLVSSTAVALTFSERGRQHRTLAPAYSVAIVLAATVMFLRMLVEIFAIRPALVLPAAIPITTMLVLGLVGCLFLWRRVRAAPPHEEPARLSNPFRLRQALRLGLVYAIIRFVAAIAWSRLGSRGLLVSAAVSGLADVDAITISVANMHRHGLETGVAVGAITIAAVANTIVKAGIAAVLGGRRIALPVAAVLLPVAAAGALLSILGP